MQSLQCYSNGNLYSATKLFEAFCKHKNADKVSVILDGACMVNPIITTCIFLKILWDKLHLVAENKKDIVEGNSVGCDG